MLAIGRVAQDRGKGLGQPAFRGHFTTCSLQFFCIAAASGLGVAFLRLKQPTTRAANDIFSLRFMAVFQEAPVCKPATQGNDKRPPADP